MRVSETADRDREIFCAIEMKHEAPSALAERFGLSLLRVHQIVAEQRVVFAAQFDVRGRTLDPVEVYRLYDLRLGHLCEEAMAAWRASKGITSQRKGAGSPIAGGVTAHPCGQVSYLLLAGRLEFMRADFAIRLAKWMFEREAKAKKSSDNPCARPAAVAAPVVKNEPDSDALNDGAGTSYDDAAAFDDAISLPVHSAPTPVRSRKERKRRARMLQRALAKR